jgi:hypothetical protein
MARWYASFDNEEVEGREAAASDGYYERVAISTGSTLKAALISTRAALSSAAYGVINTGNQDGSLGIVVPPDVVTRGGGDYSWSNLYTNTGAVWPSDPRTRPTAQILSSNSTPVSPTDAGTISDTLYTDAVTALENCFTAMTGGGPRARIGFNPYRTLASIFHDHALTYLAWDDFTPGTVQSFTVTGLGSTTDFVAALTWASWQFPNDANVGNTVEIAVTLTRTDGGGSETYTENRTLTAGTYPTSLAVNVAFPTVVAGTYQLNALLTIADAVINTHVGTAATAVETNVTIGSI